MGNIMRIFFSFLILCSLIQITNAQNLKDVENQLRQFQVNRSLYFNYDLYQFAATQGDSSHLSIIVSIVNDLLQFVKESDSLYVANFEITFTITESKNQLISDKTFRKSISVDNFKETNSRTNVHLYYYAIDLLPGEYQLLLELTDLDIRKSLTRKKEFEILDLFENPLEISDPLVTSDLTEDRLFQIEPLTEVHPKSNIAQLILNSRLLSPVLIGDKVHYRAKSPFKVFNEFYQQAGLDSLNVRYQLKNTKQEIVWKSNKSFFSTQQDQFHNTIQFDPSEQQPGLYILNILVSRGIEEKSKEIRIYFRKKITENVEDTSDINIAAPLQHILSKNEFEYINSFEKSQRDSLIVEFWNERDPSPLTEKNELKEEFIHRVRFANQNFHSLLSGKQGWQTDQGRIYILNGPPTEIFHPSIENEDYQHEIWVYENPNLKMRFVFVFKPEKGEYELLARG